MSAAAGTQHEGAAPPAAAPPDRAHPDGRAARRRLLATSGAAGAALLAAACATPGTAPAGGPAPGGAPAVISTPTEILVWLNDHGPEAQIWIESELLPRFKTEQPNVTVNIKWENWTGVAERLNAVFAADSAPDVFTGGAEWAGSLALKGQSRDISAYVRAWGEASDFVDSAIAATTMNGKNYGVPVTSDARTLVYRKDLFRAAGLNPDKGPATWDELLDFGRRVTKSEGTGISVAGYGMTVNWSSWCAYMYQAGGDYVTKEGTKATVGTPAALEWAQFIWDIYHKYKLVEAKGVPGAFEAGGQAMTEAGPGVGLAMDKAGAGADQVGIPDPTKHKLQQTSVFTNWLTISSQSKAPDAAWKFIQFYTRAEHLEQFHKLRGGLPPRKSLQQKPYVKDNPVFRRFAEIGQQYGRAFTPSCAWTDFRQQLIDFNKEMAEKQVTPKQALPELEKQMVQSLSLCVK
ncbi:MAG TPA: extracellular solute-binding protein [Chloroflexota bacterium]|nr:extracellular solute-binding protein [Chloroflexota bacterium]